jgi:hypothetical protein
VVLSRTLTRFRGPFLPVRERSCIRWRADIATAGTWVPRLYRGELRRKLRRTATRPACSCHRRSGTRASRGRPAAAPTSPPRCSTTTNEVSARQPPDEIRTCNTRFRDGSSVADCVHRLTCRFTLVVDGRACSHFALVSRSARMTEVEPGCTVWLVPRTERGINGRVPGPPPFPRPGRLARRVVGVNGGACAIAARRRQAPLTPATRRGRSPAEGAATRNPLIPLFRFVADRCDDLGLPRSRTLDVCGRLVLPRCH